MVVVAMVAAIVIVVVVAKVLVWAASIFGIVVVVEVLSIGVLADVEIIVVGVIAIILKVPLPIPYSVDVPSGLVVDSFMDAVICGALTGIGIEVLADVTANAFAVVMIALEFPVSTPLEEFGC